MSNTTVFNIDSSEVKAYTDYLRTLHRKHLPSACRSTINDAAIYVKNASTGMNKDFKKNFTIRKPTFLRSHSWATKATGFDINKMQSQVGVVKVGSGNSAKSAVAAEELKLQEFGGSKPYERMYNAESRGVQARKGRKKTIDLVQPRNYLKPNLDKGYTNGSFKYKGTKRSRFIAAAYVALREKKLMKVDKQLFIIHHVMKQKGKVFIFHENFANIDESRSAHYKQQKFLLPASQRATNMLGQFYKENVKFQLQKAKK